MGLGITIDMVIEAKAGDYLKKLEELANEPEEEDIIEEDTGNPVKDLAKKNREEQRSKRKQRKEEMKKEAKEYKNKLKEQVSGQVQIMIDELDAKFESMTQAVKGISRGLSSLLTASAITPDPQAPNASAGVKASALATSNSWNGQLESVANQIKEVEGGVTKLLGNLGPAKGPLDGLRNTIGNITLPV